MSVARNVNFYLQTAGAATKITSVVIPRPCLIGPIQFVTQFAPTANSDDLRLILTTSTAAVTTVDQQTGLIAQAWYHANALTAASLDCSNLNHVVPALGIAMLPNTILYYYAISVGASVAYQAYCMVTLIE